MKSWLLRGCALLSFLALVVLPCDVHAQDAVQDDTAALFDAAVSSDSLFGLIEVDTKKIIVLDDAIFGRDMLWYSEAVRLPAEVTTPGGNAIGEAMVRLEKRNNRVFIRDLTSAATKRATPDGQGESDRRQSKLDPIQVAISDASFGTIIQVLEVVAEADGKTVLDVTDVLAKDHGGVLSAARFFARSGLVPVGVDPARSYIDDVKAYPRNLSFRSHLTFVAADGTAASAVIGHSIVLLPETPMPSRAFDPRVGYFATSFFEFGEAAPVREGSVILRHRLEKSDPGAEVSDPVQPIVFYVGQGVPERWRAAVKAGIESWAPAFEKAGFSNAIVAKIAPSPEEDPDWAAEDARRNIVRWLPQPVANAMGPVIYDPRSGEIISAHILIWPQVIPFFSQYYHILHASVDPDAQNLPLPDALSDRLLTYIVAHEVGHALGLRHNHLASTAYSTEQLRDPIFANEMGPNASIMAYGRFNQVARPGDRVSQFVPIQGPYDRFAIEWGYRQFDNMSVDEEQLLLHQMATAAAADRNLAWAAGEMRSEFRSKRDPRVQTENTGSDRVAATQGAAGRISVMLDRLPDVAGDNDELFRELYDQALGLHAGHLRSVLSEVGGVNIEQQGGARFQTVDAAIQRRSVEYLLTQGQAGLEMFAAPALIERLEPTGALRVLDGHRALLVLMLLDGERLGILDAQKTVDETAYGAADLGQDVVRLLFGDLSTGDRGQRAMQEAFVDAAAQLLAAEPDEVGIAVALSGAIGVDIDQYVTANASGSGTVFPAWARSELPRLARRLRGATAEMAEDDIHRFHFETLAGRIDAMVAQPYPLADPQHVVKRILGR